MRVKHCYHCNQDLPVENFGKNKSKTSGLADECRPCARIRQHNYIKRRGFVRQKYNNSLKGQYHTYKYKGNRKNKFNLTFDEFISFNDDCCHYCGVKPKRIGLDRVDNNEGYNIWNVVRCCKECNVAKNNRTVKEFINQCRRIVYGTCT